MSQYETALPNPKNLIHALRDIGYSLETAIADIIDNSISASASEINIFINFDLHNSYIAIIDNGSGMSESKLKEAMNLGSMDPLAHRDGKDLGRFGLGLKTASFSQAGKLTVVSSQIKKRYGRCWDLNHIAKTEKWELEVLDNKKILSLPKIDSLRDTGTYVLWQNLYKLIDTNSKRDPRDIFLEKINSAREHLELVFHRYLAGEQGLKKLSIKLNNDELKPFNPFEGAGKPFPEERFYNIRMQAYLLPHHSKVSPEQYRHLAGKEGYMKSQGFYVYRNARLLIHGTWFRLARQSESTKLARVQIDLPNSEDFSWSIDVKKSHATPPDAIRQQLKRTIEKITAQASRVYTKRGAKIARKDIVPIWYEYHKHREKSYRINIDNPLIKEFYNTLSENQRAHLKEIFSLIENSLPIDSIYSTMMQTPEQIKQKSIDSKVLIDAAEKYWKLMQKAGVEKDEIITRMQKHEPFSEYPEFCEKFINEKRKQNS